MLSRPIQVRLLSIFHGGSAGNGADRHVVRGRRRDAALLPALRAAAAPRAALIALHGLGDHSGLYPMVGEALAPRGIAVSLPDLRGNGRSPGPRGHIDAWDDLREDLRCLVQRTRAEAPGRRSSCWATASAGWSCWTTRSTIPTGCAASSRSRRRWARSACPRRCWRSGACCRGSGRASRSRPEWT